MSILLGDGSSEGHARVTWLADELTTGSPKPAKQPGIERQKPPRVPGVILAKLTKSLSGAIIYSRRVSRYGTRASSSGWLRLTSFGENRSIKKRLLVRLSFSS
ncbi:hypothetical protein PoB_000999400 [Plakobranchus ocellatus]|uniref:Uncharacterized protein n=1 Tax=Plakobranchus ocellatus TaxID=259542 RepID=A0AAV3YKE1_9GAST|nr:hypothetical protein PoB_000999400 [Plakobranchus ocellatus]